jgi:SAM-dependent methyltransferase
MQFTFKNVIRLLSGEIPIKSKIKSALTPRKNDDDFNWDLYNEHYRRELDSCQKEFTLILNSGDYELKNNQLLQGNNSILPLIPNHRLLYETILQLDPSSICEIGCGGGDHLSNLELLNPNFQKFGFDISRDQLDYLKERHPNLDAVVKIEDFTLPYSRLLPTVDIVYSQAVIMHIQTGNSHLTALTNMFCMAKKQVVLMENWTRHPFMGDIQRLYDREMIPWKELYFYYKDAPEFQKPHLMIVSSEKLNIDGFKQLDNYEAFF